MLRAICVLFGCVHEGEQQLPEHRCAGVQIGTFEVGLGFQEELSEVFGHLAAALEGSHVRSVQRLCVRREVPLDVAQFDVWPGVAQDASIFPRKVLWCTIQNQELGYQLSVNRACVHVRVNRVDGERLA